MTTPPALDGPIARDLQDASRACAARIVPVDLDGRAGSAAGLVRELRPFFRDDLSVAVELVVAPLAASTLIFAAGGASRRTELAISLLAGARIAGRIADDEHVALRRAGTDWVVSGRTPIMAATAQADIWAIPCRNGDGATGVLLCSADALEGRGIDTVETVGLCGASFATVDLDGYAAPRRDVVVTDDAAAARLSLRTRVIVAALCVASVERALHLALAYAAGRELYRGAVLDIPHARGLLAEARTDLLIADAVSAHAVESIDDGRSDAETAAHCAIALVPRLLNDSLRALSILFGSTFYARVDPYSRFETLVRDVGSLSLLGLSGRAPRNVIVRATEDAAIICRSFAARADIAAADQAWLSCALTRLDARLSRRRPVLPERAVESAIEDMGLRAASGQSMTFDHVPLSTSPLDPPR